MVQTKIKPLTEVDAYAWATWAMRHLQGIGVEPHLLQRLADDVVSAILRAQDRGAATTKAEVPTP